MRIMLAIRSAFAEDRLEQAAARGIRQYVMFGSGLDTFLGGSRILPKTCRFLRSITK
jgi:hypothetical protein